ncbi:MAG TPA: hypothetical protein VLE69_00590 [Candidatus Saccharimonadales bacterium]|nr:hypothetical protein [Candidatus Saccharimonadales bacterium]
MKKKIAFGLFCLLLTLGIFSKWGTQRLGAATVYDSCMGVNTAFTATYPSSVTSGSAFTVSGITSRPDNSYKVTVTSATLYLSATNASETTYAKNATSTNPSPTTGADTYTGYYPNWSLTATGAAGNQVVVKLVKAVAQTVEYGTISCDLTKTLANVNITAVPPPPPSGGGGTGGGTSGGGTSSGGTSSGGSTTSSSGTNTTTNTTSSGGTTSQKIAALNPTTPKTITTASGQVVQVLPVIIVVKDKGGNAIKGAKVSIDDGEAVETDTEGGALFKDIVLGEHNTTVSYNNLKAKKAFTVSANNQINSVTVTIAKPTIIQKLVLPGLIGIGSILVVGTIIVVIIRKRAKFRGFQPVPGQMGTMGESQVFTGDMSGAQITPGVSAPQPVQNQPIVPPQPSPAIPTLNTTPYVGQYPAPGQNVTGLPGAVISPSVTAPAGPEPPMSNINRFG